MKMCLILQYTCEEPLIRGLVSTEDEAKEVIDWFKNHLILEYDDDRRDEIYYEEIEVSSVADMTTKLDLHFGKQNEAWEARHNAKRYLNRE